MESSEIVDLLRDEIASYGTLLGLFEEQQSHLFSRNVDKVLHTAAMIDLRVAEAAQCREAREGWLASFARSKGEHAGSSLRKLLEFFPLEERPMLEACIDEINRLIHQVRRRARQNHSFMEKMLELHRELVLGLAPGAAVTTYASTGQLSEDGLRASSLQQVG